ncbi:MAG: TRAP transporter small permease [Desulfobacterales bacterium]|nr:TRAP transporter small permease [Desulfobacterales bacterium]MDX2511076.1 TRAP transporter small permease [Desulfobacterales bacterium]
MTNTTVQLLDKTVCGISRVFNTIGLLMLMLMMFLVTVDVFLRYIFNSPIEGVYEAVEFMMAVVFCYSIAHTQRCKGHVSVNLVTLRLSARNKAITDSMVSLISFSVFALMTWQSFLKAGDIMHIAETSTGGIAFFGPLPVYPFMYMTSAACLVFCLELLVDFFVSITSAVKR